jgi:hypothetical protein
MAEDSLIQARKRAERAVAGMEDGPLKIAAFQTILAKLLTESDLSASAGHASVSARPRTEARSDTLRGRVLIIRSEGFFKSQRTLGEVREALGSRGWHYPPTTLSGLMQGLVRNRELRRERVSVGGKQVWRYSNA